MQEKEGKTNHKNQIHRRKFVEKTAVAAGFMILNSNLVRGTAANSALDCYGSVGRNTLRGPTWVNLGFSVFRTFAISEEVGLQFRAEFFNLPNNPKFNNPTSSASSSSFMFITSTNENWGARTIRWGLKFKF